jgi:GTP cyclohydrolase N terminal
LRADLGRTYPGQAGINPLPMDWGNKNPQQRGPVVVSRSATTIRRRNGKRLVIFLVGSDADGELSYWR